VVYRKRWMHVKPKVGQNRWPSSIKKIIKMENPSSLKRNKTMMHGTSLAGTIGKRTELKKKKPRENEVSLSLSRPSIPYLISE
jgi:hypothetical protein